MPRLGSRPHPGRAGIRGPSSRRAPRPHGARCAPAGLLGVLVAAEHEKLRPCHCRRREPGAGHNGLGEAAAGQCPPLPSHTSRACRRPGGPSPTVAVWVCPGAARRPWGVRPRAYSGPGSPAPASRSRSPASAPSSMPRTSGSSRLRA